MLNLFKLSLSALLTVSVYDICHQLTFGFAMVNIQPTAYKAFETTEDKAKIDEILNQPFYLFANGGQSYVFKSKDDQYVLKLFKCHHMRIPPWIQALPLQGHLGEWKRKKMAYKKGVLDKTFTSYENAYNFFKDSSRLLELNLSNQKNRYKSKIVIYDAQNIPFEIDPNVTPFALQKKLALFESTILRKLKEKDHRFVLESSKKCIDLLVSRINQGFIDNDCYLHKNIGLDGDEPILLDIGTLEKVPDLTKKTKINQVEYVMKSIFEMLEQEPSLHEALLLYWKDVQATLS
jgi:hypothetical protein